MGRNTCAQRVASRLLGVPAHELERTHPPDTPLRLLGTTPRQLAAMLTARGRASTAAWALPGERPRAEDAVCVDLRHLHGGIPRLHWMLVEDTHDERLRLDGRWYAWDRAERAWACRASPLPMHRRAYVRAEGNRYPPAPGSHAP